MERLTFKNLNTLCELNFDKKHVGDCLQVLRHEDCIFESGIIMPHDHIASLYKLRFDIAKENSKVSEHYLTDFENCVDNLIKSRSEFLGITSVYSNNNCFLIFYEPDTEIILGILKSESSSDIRSMEENINDSIKKGLSSSAEKYSNGTFI